ncbi:MAG: DUF131 domain-containing protein [Thermoplasmatales archaeon]|nr:DUF131 domain-containing protein [Thermoplasmatales archaeon]
MENKIPLIFFIFAIIAFIFAFIEGELKAGLFLIFPFVYGNGIFTFIGIILLFLSFLLFFISSLKRIEGEVEYKESKGGVILIGPFPVIISDNIKNALFLLIFSLVVFIVFVLFFLAI